MRITRATVLAALLATSGAAAIVGCGSDDGASDQPAASSSGATQSSSGGSSTSSGGHASSSSSSGATSSGSTTSSSGGSSGASSSSSGGVATAPWLVQCFYGAAFGTFTAANDDIEAACSALPYDLVKTCTGANCKVGWAFTAQDAAYDALIAALDDNGDGAVDDTDAPHSIALLGHSWGGMNLTDVGSRIAADDRVAASRKTIKLGVAWEPYKPGATLAPTSNFERYIVLRRDNTGNPADDCSSLIGPFYGYAPHCPAGQNCTDYDYTTSPNDSFPAYPSGTILGKNVEHCNAFNVGFPVAKAILDATTLPPLPQSVPVLP